MAKPFHKKCPHCGGPLHETDYTLDVDLPSYHTVVLGLAHQCFNCENWFYTEQQRNCLAEEFARIIEMLS